MLTASESNTRNTAQILFMLSCGIVLSLLQQHVKALRDLYHNVSDSRRTRMFRCPRQIKKKTVGAQPTQQGYREKEESTIEN